MSGRGALSITRQGNSFSLRASEGTSPDDMRLILDLEPLVFTGRQTYIDKNPSKVGHLGHCTIHIPQILVEFDINYKPSIVCSSYIISDLGIQNIQSGWIEMIPACSTVNELNFQIYFIQHNL